VSRDSPAATSSAHLAAIANRADTIFTVPYFICPNCKDRSVDSDGREGFSSQPVACQRCGFGFLFELMDDYYPAPTAGMVVCDRDGRILALGRGIFELSGFRENDLMGRDVVESLGLSGFESDRNPARIALEWGVRRLGEELRLRTRGGQQKEVVADFFPAYDEDGGLLVALTPR
jgi:PAS domain-containing protein